MLSCHFIYAIPKASQGEILSFVPIRPYMYNISTSISLSVPLNYVKMKYFTEIAYVVQCKNILYLIYFILQSFIFITSISALYYINIIVYKYTLPFIIKYKIIINYINNDINNNKLG